ncbi:hypothetical protein PF011_g19783 [Phytophthora fragariae]|uniref:Uncharacterized protein n=2 Tax=Phytophthora fragariae TaxID=53985 RepID=A0A6A3J648_9STRA|nr:hypothetical protein PF011_g19783 [Phytophthora fragariae]
MESIGENAENLGGAPAASGVSPPDGSGGGGQPTLAAANPPQTTNEGAGDQTGPRPILTDPNRPDLYTPAGLGAVRSQVQRWAARASTTPASGADQASNPLLAPTTTTTTTMGLPVMSAPNLVNQPDPSTLVNAPSVQPVPNTLRSSPGNGGGVASSGQPGQVQYWNQTGGGYIAQVMPDPNGGWPQVTQTPYGAVVPPTPTTMMTTMTPPTTRVRTAIPSYQNYTIGTPAVAAGVGGGYPVFQPAGWAQTLDPNRPRSAPDARTTQPVAWTPSVGTTPLSYPNQYAYPSQAATQMPPVQYVLPTPSVQYAQAPPAARTQAPTQSVPTPTGSQPMMAGAPPPPGGTPPTGGPTPTQVQAPAQGVPTPSGPPPPNPMNYGPPQAPPPYSYGNAYGQAPDPRRYGVDKEDRPAVSAAEDDDYEGREEEALPNEMATYDPTELDYWNGNQEAEACVQQAASVTTARDKESAPEHDHDDAKPEVEACVQQATSVTTACDKESAPKYDYNDVKHEVDACAQPATSVTTARDERSAPEPDCDYNDYNYENPEVEACAQQATSTLAARDEESALVPEHDHDEEEQEAGVCSPQAASVIEARDSKSVLTPDEEDETKTETVAGVCTPLGAAVTTNPDENPATRAESDGSVSAVLVLFKRPVCDPDPDRTVVYESFGCNTGWGLARAALAAQERAAQAEADEESLCEVSPSSDSRRTGESKGGTTTVNSASTTPDPLVPERPPTESILSEEDGLSQSPVPKHPSTESILSKEDGNNLGPALKCPLPEAYAAKKMTVIPVPRRSVRHLKECSAKKMAVNLVPHQSVINPTKPGQHPPLTLECLLMMNWMRWRRENPPRRPMRRKIMKRNLKSDYFL